MCVFTYKWKSFYLSWWNTIVIIVIPVFHSRIHVIQYINVELCLYGKARYCALGVELASRHIIFLRNTWGGLMFVSQRLSFTQKKKNILLQTRKHLDIDPLVTYKGGDPINTSSKDRLPRRGVEIGSELPPSGPSTSSWSLFCPT